MKRKLIVIFICILMIIVAACSCKEKHEDKPSVVVNVVDTKLEIRSGIVYVTLHNGETYKTTLKADEIDVYKPKPGEGTVVTATILKNHARVAVLHQSYVDEYMTKERAEDCLGCSLTSVSSSFEIADEIIISIVVLSIAVIVVIICQRKLKKKK